MVRSQSIDRLSTVHQIPSNNQSCRPRPCTSLHCSQGHATVCGSMVVPEYSHSNSRSSGAIHMLLIALLTGLACYGIGRMDGSSSHWLVSSSSSNNEYYHKAVVADYDYSDNTSSPEYYSRENPISSSIPMSKTTNSSSSSLVESAHSSKNVNNNDRISIVRPSLPYNCGVIFFYHIPSTGGASINNWFKKFQRPSYGNISYYQHWQLETRRDGSFHPDPVGCETNFSRGMTAHIQNLGPNEWRIAHSHLVSTYLNESENLLHQWRQDVEVQGCQMINTVMLREPLNHAMSLHKIVKQKRSNRVDWIEYLHSPTGTGLWSTILDFFLYNTHGNRTKEEYPNGPGGRNPFNVTMQTKVSRAMELLHRHFDIVTIGDHDIFMGKLLNLTTLTRDNTYKRMNIFKGELEFSKKEIENLQTLLQMNGDFDFIDQVKVDYYDYLSYLTK